MYLNTGGQNVIRAEKPQLVLLISVLSFRGRNLTDLLDTLKPIRVSSELVSQTGRIVGELSGDEPNSRGELSSEERDETESH